MHTFCMQSNFCYTLSILFQDTAMCPRTRALLYLLLYVLTLGARRSVNSTGLAMIHSGRAKVLET